MIFIYNINGRLGRTELLLRKDEIYKWVEEKKSFRYMQSQLQCTYRTLKKLLRDLNINYNGDFKPFECGYNGILNHGKTSVKEYLGTDKYISTNKLKKKLIEEGIKEYKCENCNNSEWLGNKIPLELHHINGNPYDNSLENLQLLCPNCHTFTNTFRGKNRKSNKKDKKSNLRKEQLHKLSLDRLELLQNSNIDFTKFGWGVKVSKLFGIASQAAIKYVREHYPDFYKNCYQYPHHKLN